jgi:tRNA nucleotidyltransferase (CCA-adding enzyme)
VSSDNPNYLELLDQLLPVSHRHVPLRVRDVARGMGLRVALVGGIPRDLLRVTLGQTAKEMVAGRVPDFDISVQGDARAFAYEVARRLPGRLVVNEAFQTASLSTDDPVKIDMAATRTETYPAPGQLPVVDTSAVTLEADLARRDFTVNALAIELGDDFGRLIDTHGAAGDIRERLIRTLNSGSFFDDPTRMFRALRYSIRLDYSFELTTREQLFGAIEEQVVDALTPERIRYEIECIGREEHWAATWQAMGFSYLAPSIHDGMSDLNRGWLPSDARALDIAIANHRELLRAEGIEPWLVRSAWALSGVRVEHLESVCSRIGLFPRQTTAIVQARSVLRDSAEIRIEAHPPSLVCSLLEKYQRHAVVFAAFILQPRVDYEVDLRRTLLRYLVDWSNVRSELNGDDLIRLGLRPGPSLGELHGKLRYLKLDGILHSREAELEYAREFIESMTDIPESAEETPQL